MLGEKRTISGTKKSKAARETVKKRECFRETSGYRSVFT